MGNNSREIITKVLNIAKNEVAKVIIGQENVVDHALIAIFSGAHALIEGVPGVAKTLLVRTLAHIMRCDFARIQFTPDLMPADITGTHVFNLQKNIFSLVKGPVFTTFLLADEINRAPAKVQAALLEAMEERQVTVAGKTRKMPELFMVLATQNPIEQEGTYPLPEAQTDRFLMHITIDYPSDDDELQIIRLVRSEEGGRGMLAAESQSIPQEAVFEARSGIQELYIAENVEKYIVQIISATRRPEKYSEQLARWIEVGASPRGTLALDKTSRAHAWLNAQKHVTPDDVRAVVFDCLRHRLILSYEANAEEITPDQVIEEIVKVVAVA